MFTAWLVSPLRLHAGPFHLTIHWGWKPVVAPWLILMARLGLRSAVRAQKGPAPRGLLGRPFFQKAVMALLSVVFFLFGIEQALKWAGYEALVPPIVIQDDRAQVVDNNRALVPDPTLRWRFTPGAMFKGMRINSLGFREREVLAEKPAGWIRVICMGDSCSADGGPAYAGILNRFLEERPLTTNRWEAFNMAVYGYSSVLGYALFRQRVPPLAPDVVTLYFGWNDHWRSGYMPDSRIIAIPMRPARARIYEILRNKRFGQLLIDKLSTARNRAIRKVDGQLPKDLENELRVPPDEYRQTLRDFVHAIRRIGAVPLLITAPRGDQVWGQMAATLARNVNSLEEAIALHEQYVQITREVAAETGAPLLDLRAMLDGSREAGLFNRDAIHLTNLGLTNVAEKISVKLGEIVESAEWQAGRHPTPPAPLK